jgi:hypothetical protein
MRRPRVGNGATIEEKEDRSFGEDTAVRTVERRFYVDGQVERVKSTLLRERREYLISMNILSILLNLRLEYHNPYIPGYHHKTGR